MIGKQHYGPILWGNFYVRIIYFTGEKGESDGAAHRQMKYLGGIHLARGFSEKEKDCHPNSGQIQAFTHSTVLVELIFVPVPFPYTRT